MAASTTTVSGDIPSVLEPFYVGSDVSPGLIERGISAIYPSSGQQADIEAAYAMKYGPETGIFGTGSVAGMSQFQEQLGTDLANLQAPDAYAKGVSAADLAAAGYQGVGGVAAPELTMYQMADPTMFGYEQAQQYMSPYMQAVVDSQQRKAIEAAKQAQLGANLGSARSGTYGGARQTLLQGQREAGLRAEMGDLQARGLQSAYESAQQQFERDRQAQYAANQANLNAALGVQQLGAGQSLEAQRANQAAQLAAAQGLGGLASTYGTLGTQDIAAQLDILKTQGAYGDLQRAIEQQQLDAQKGYQAGAANYGIEQVGQLSNLLRGIPMTDTTQTTSTPPPSFASQLAGLGIGGLSLYNLLTAPG